MPSLRIGYDNLKPAVVRVLRGRDRQETERFIALRSHYAIVDRLTFNAHVIETGTESYRSGRHVL